MKFQEAIDLVNLKACRVVKNNEDLNTYLNKLFLDKNYRNNKGKITKQYILQNIGATEIILNYISEKI